jgi:uncharacterized protein (TIGR03067 family)
MNLRLLLIAALALQLLGCNSSSSDNEKIKGNWKLHQMTGDFTFGLPTYKMDNDFMISFQEKTFSFITSKSSGLIIKGTFNCDEQKKPKQITFTVNNQNIIGIYLLVNNNLQICFGKNDLLPPERFIGGPASRPALLEFTRETK